MSKYNIPLVLDNNNSHAKIIKRVQPNSVILEFGPAHGVMSKYLCEVLHCSVYAVEYDLNAAKDAEPFCTEIIVANIEDYGWELSFAGIKFDHIIFADVLEHLYNPWEVLKRVRPFLKEHGSVLISLPNIAHNAIIMNLLEGKFEYKPTGLLDNTHIRFFTKNSIDSMIKECGYRVTDIDSVFIQPSSTEFEQSYLKFNKGTVASLAQNYYGHVYQFIYEISEGDYDLNIYNNYDISEPVLLKIFFDTGGGFREEQSQMIYCNNGTTLLDLPKKDIINNIRVDILSVPTIIHRFKPTIKDDRDYEVNSFCRQFIDGKECDSKQFYTSQHPQFIITPQINCGLTKIIFNLEAEIIYLSKDFGDKELMINLLNQRLEEMDQRLNESNGTVANLV